MGLLDPPIKASFDLTYKCNLRCKMCNVWRIDKKEEKLNSENWKAIVDSLIKSFSVRFFRLVGGEVFLYPEWKEVVHHIKRRGCRLDIVTNGTLIDEEIARFLVCEKVDQIRISLDGFRESHDFYRGEGAFLKTMKGIHNLIRETKKGFSRVPKITLHPFVSLVNYREIEKVFTLSRQLQTEFTYHFLGGTTVDMERLKDPGFPRNLKKASALSPAEKRKFRKKDFYLLSRRNWIAGMLLRIFNLPLCRDCPRISYHLIIDPWGYIFPCERLYKYSYGNCKDKSVEEIWRSNRRTIIRQNVRAGVMPECHECGHRICLLPLNLSGFQTSRLGLTYLGL